jgi:hypothetical protein
MIGCIHPFNLTKYQYYRMNRKFNTILVAFIWMSWVTGAQVPTRAHGFVRDVHSGEGLPFASVAFPGFPIGTITGLDGSYTIETRMPVDSIQATSLGYIPQAYLLKPHSDQIINFLLKQEEYAIEEVVIRPGENPAHRMLRNIVANRDRNNLSRLASYQYKGYNKIRIDMSNVDGVSRMKIFRPFDFVFENIDTNATTGKTSLPLLMSETVSDFYYQSKPRKEKEFITASKISGTQNESISQFTAKLYEKYSIYDNVITLFEIGWISPLSENGLHFYKYHLTDTAIFDNHLCYHILFEPLRKQERTFTGDFWVADTSWAIRKITMRINPEANINFVHDLEIENEYAPIADTTWFPLIEKLFVDVNLTKKTFGFAGVKVSTFQDILLDNPVPRAILKEPNDLVVVPGAGKTPDSYWEEQRPIQLEDKEVGIYSMIDSIQQVPLYKTFQNGAAMLFTNYYIVGLFEIGPYYRMYSYNPIEGNRFRFGGRTSNEFSTNLMLDGYLAYGTEDMRYKYGGGFIYLFNKNPRTAVGLSYANDMRQLGQSENGFNADNFLFSFLRRNPNYKITMVKEIKGYVEKEWFHGLTNMLTLRHFSIYPTSYVPFNLENGGQITALSSLTTAEISLNTRFAWQEKYYLGEFDKISLGTKWPVVNLNFTLGLKGIYKSQYSYQKLNLEITDDVELAPYGYTRYTFDGGAIFGVLPYPLLELHKGNETYQYDYMGFNMMNYYEFVSDKYVSIFAEHHFDGFFFNHVPLLRKLKLREVATGRALYGTLNKDQYKMMQFSPGLGDLNKGYYELGAGIENIFRFIRVDAIWRLSYLDHKDIQPFGIRVSMQVVL